MRRNLEQYVRRVCRWFMVFILTTLLITTSPIIGLCALPYYILRFVAVKYSKCFRPDLGKILTTRSAIFATDDLYGNPKANIVVAVIVRSNYTAASLECKQNMIDKQINARTQTGELANPEYRQYVSSFLGFPFWKWDTSFNIDNHVKKYDGRIPISVLTQDILNELSTEYLKAPFAPGRSPWEWIFFPVQFKLTPEDSDDPRTAIIFRCHHTLADGFAIAKIGLSVFSDHKAKQTTSKPKLSNFRKILFFVRFLFVAPFECVNCWIETRDVNKCHISKNKLSPNTSVAFERIPWNYLQEIKRSHGTGMTAVLLAAFTGGIRSYMIENGYKIPETIHAILPIPMSGHPDKLRNHMSVGSICLPIGLSTPQERLLAIEKSFQKLKRSTQPITNFYLSILVGAFPSCIARHMQQNIVKPTALFSNFPGPQDQLDNNGKPLEEIMVTEGPFLRRIGIGFNALSYNGVMRIQAAFNEALAVNKLPRRFLLDKVLQELQILSEKHV